MCIGIFLFFLIGLFPQYVHDALTRAVDRIADRFFLFIQNRSIKHPKCIQQFRQAGNIPIRIIFIQNPLDFFYRVFQLMVDDIVFTVIINFHRFQGVIKNLLLFTLEKFLDWFIVFSKIKQIILSIDDFFIKFFRRPCCQDVLQQPDSLTDYVFSRISIIIFITYLYYF